MIHVMYQVVKHVAKEEEKEGKNHKWQRCLDKQLGRHRFQMDLGNDLMKAGIAMDWKDLTDKKQKPVCIRKHDWIPCNCKICFFCVNGLTCGVAHKTRGAKRNTPSHARPACSKDRMPMGTQNSSCCAMCIWRGKAANPGMTLTKIRESCTQSRLGCLTCQEHVCEEC